MRKKLFTALFLLVFIFCNTAFATNKEKEGVSDLTPWLGYSVSILKLYQGEVANKYFAEVKKHAPEGYTIEMVKDFIYNQFSSKFNSLRVIDENTITIDNKITGDYAYVGSINTVWKNQKKITWEIFKTDSKEMIEAGYKYFLFFPFHQHGKNSLRHAHLRYGNENFDYLVTDPSVQSWWPTIYQPEKTDESKIMAQMIEKAKLQASMLPQLK
ncbi:MAG: hypothetical protein CSA33_06015 [Desulfobulbus propionicus]|nr:MAG: hypothetical protein CSA33_06015 [Desulfobulbus propionicus]